jgi:hypothetical protein
MPDDQQSIQAKQEKFQIYLPVIAFIILIFILEVFQLQKATSLVIAVFVSVFIYGIMAARARQKFGDLPVFKRLNLYLGILTFLMIIIVGIAVLHWFQLVHVNLRWLLFFLVLLVYFIALFRAVHTLHGIVMSLKDRQPDKKP